MDNRALRKNTVETIALLVERYPNQRVGELIDAAVGGIELHSMTDVELARALNQLFISYTQFEAAGIKP